MPVPRLPSIADKKTLVQRIISEIQERLLKGVLRAGDRLPPEGELAAQFGVGRTSVREAMKVLSALGVVAIRRGDGTFVASGDSFQLLNPLEFALILERGDARELLELRRVIDLGCCDLVVQRATKEDIDRLSNLAKQHKALVESGAAPDVIGAKDIEFHRAFLGATRNRPMIKVGRTIWALFVQSILNADDPQPVTKKSVQHHVDIVCAIEAGDVEKAKEIIEAHLAMWYASTLDPDKSPAGVPLGRRASARPVRRIAKRANGLNMR
jgi:GntR family transcriptional repressor for pyruvate dehydrogenase complex